MLFWGGIGPIPLSSNISVLNCKNFTWEAPDWQPKELYTNSLRTFLDYTGIVLGIVALISFVVLLFGMISKILRRTKIIPVTSFDIVLKSIDRNPRIFGMCDDEMKSTSTRNSSVSLHDSSSFQFSTSSWRKKGRFQVLRELPLSNLVLERYGRFLLEKSSLPRLFLDSVRIPTTLDSDDDDGYSSLKSFNSN